MLSQSGDSIVTSKENELKHPKDLSLNSSYTIYQANLEQAPQLLSLVSSPVIWNNISTYLTDLVKGLNEKMK